MDKKIIVISGVNLVDGGPLSVYLDFLTAIVCGGYSENNRVIALVGNKKLFSQFENSIELIEFPESKKSWFKRIQFEYSGFKKLSEEFKPDIWISMHDTTPNVTAGHRYVYCHNPSPFNKMSVKDAKFGLKYYLFSKFYKYLYKINIKKNDAVIVQQDWMRKEFMKMYGLKKVIVARPSIPEIEKIQDTSISDGEKIFVCPSFPRYYKNFQIVCEAAKILESRNVNNFKVYITLNGDENKYSEYLKNSYSSLNSVVFCGLLPRDDLFKLFGRSSCMMFMSKLETWGMPITEFKTTGKPIIVADLPYAHETAGTYNNVSFVDVNDAVKLADEMEKIISGNGVLGSSSENKVAEPYAEGWDKLCRLIIEKDI